MIVERPIISKHGHVSIFLLLSLFLQAVMACSHQTPADRQVTPQPSATIPPPSFQSVLAVGSARLQAQIVDRPETRERGLMFVNNLPEDCGMLFIFEQEEILSFWMKNTSIPLSIGFFDREMQLLEVRDMKPFILYPTIKSSRPALYALEVNQGWFARKGVVPGDRLSIVQP